MTSQQTLRIGSLPPKIRESDVKSFFIERISKVNSHEHIVEVVGPICSQAYLDTKRTTVTFSSKRAAQQALAIRESQKVIRAEWESSSDKSSVSQISIDGTFTDLTTIYEPLSEPIDVDIVALHGLSGHPWASFMTTVDVDGRNSKEVNWLRDILPEALKNQGTNARIMIYGYNANIWVSSNVGDIKTPVNSLVNALEMERWKEPQRPLIFIGHSLGGIIVKQAINTMAKEAHEQKRKLPVRGCMFFAVPNQGSGVASDWSPILSLLGSTFGFNHHSVKDLKEKSAKLQDIAQEFRQVRREHNISVTSCWESKTMARKIVVDKDSAILEYEGRPKDYGIDADHRDIAKFRDTSSPMLLQIIQNIANIPLVEIVQSPSSTEQPMKLDDDDDLGFSSLEVEPKYSLLDRFDTVFLVDDSGSMAGYRWQKLARQILETSTKIAIRHDKDGIDVHFLNSTENNRDHVKTPEDVTALFNSTRPGGRTPLGYQLESHLNAYIGDWIEAGGRKNRKYKQLNLIILTDGEPNERFSFIENVIINAAEELKEERASQTQIGIQFCQIGNDPEAVRFLQKLDDDIRDGAKLDRDMVDTLRCRSEEDLTPAFYLKLLTGAIDNEEDEVVLPTSKTSPSEEGPSFIRPAQSSLTQDRSGKRHYTFHN